MNGACPDTVTVLSVEKRRSVVQLVLSDESERCVPAAVFRSLRLKEGQTVSRSGLDARIRALTRNAAGNKAAALLSFRGRSVRETENALRRGGFDDESVEETLASFQELGYLDDRTFTRDWIRSRLAKGIGPNRIRSELLLKGVDRTLVEDALSELDGGSAADEALTLCLSKAVRGRNLDDPKERAKALQQMVRRGYSFSEARAALDDCLKDNDPETMD